MKTNFKKLFLLIIIHFLTSYLSIAQTYPIIPQAFEDALSAIIKNHSNHLNKEDTIWIQLDENSILDGNSNGLPEKIDGYSLKYVSAQHLYTYLKKNKEEKILLFVEQKIDRGIKKTTVEIPITWFKVKAKKKLLVAKNIIDNEGNLSTAYFFYDFDIKEWKEKKK